MVEFSGVTKRYPNGTLALNGVDLKIENGEFVFIVGTSGAGKSTLMKLMLREELPTSGSIKINGFNLRRMKKKDIPRYRRSLGVVFQDFRLIPNMTAYDNVAFALRVTEASRSEIKRRTPYMLSLVGLESKAKMYPEELSGGEQQRVALARALVNNPSMIIADEPTGNIDPKMSYEIVNLLSEINKLGITVIMVTHEHELVSRFDKRVIEIKDGKVISDRMSLRSGI